MGSSSDLQERRELEAALQRATEHDETFLAVLAHELRNPLGPMQNALEALERLELTSAQADQAKRVLRRQLDQMTHLVGQLLDVASIGRGTIQLQHESVDLARLVHAALEDYRASLESRGLTVETSYAGEPLLIEGDATRIRQLVANLLHNAGKYTPAGGHVIVDLSRTRNLAVLQVRDTGIGIAPEALASVFDGLKKAARSGASDRGLRIGLSLVKAFVELHGGTVEAQSEGVGRGAAFLVRLPLALPV